MGIPLTATEQAHREALLDMAELVRGREDEYPAGLLDALDQACRNQNAVGAIAEYLPKEDEWQSACGIVEATANVLDTYEIERPDHYDEETDIR